MKRKWINIKIILKTSSSPLYLTKLFIHFQNLLSEW